MVRLAYGATQEEAILPYWRLFYHVVWATKGREALIDAHASGVIVRTISDACEKEGVTLHAIGTMPDHVHVAVSIPPAKAVAQVIARWKGASSYVLNHAQQLQDRNRFAWQTEYGIVSFSERNLTAVKAYINDQPRRHAGQAPYWDLLEEAGLNSIPAASPHRSATNDSANGNI